MRYIITLKEIESFQIFIDRILYSNIHENLKMLFLHNSETPIYKSEYYFSYNVFKDMIFLNAFSEKKVLKFDKDLNSEILFSDVDFIQNFNHSNCFLKSDKDFIDTKTTFESPQKKYFFENDIEKWSNFNWGHIFLYSNKLILQFTDPLKFESKRNQFTRLSFETGERLWDFDLDEHLDKLVSAYPYEGAWLVPDHHPQIKEPIGIYKDQLWFSMKHYGLLCLNYHTGAFMHYLRDCPENEKGWPYMLNGKFPLIPFTENAIIIENEGKMICFDSVMFWELNLETLQMDFHFLEDYLKNEVQCYTTNTRFKKLIVENEKIYMVDNLHKKFGCFNRRTLKYDWIEPLPEGSGAPKSIEKHGNRLYIDTTKKELLVYELEGNE